MFTQFIELLDPSFLRNDQNRLILAQNDPNNFGLCYNRTKYAQVLIGGA